MPDMTRVRPCKITPLARLGRKVYDIRRAPGSEVKRAGKFADAVEVVTSAYRRHNCAASAGGRGSGLYGPAGKSARAAREGDGTPSLDKTSAVRKRTVHAQVRSPSQGLHLQGRTACRGVGEFSHPARSLSLPLVSGTAGDCACRACVLMYEHAKEVPMGNPTCSPVSRRFNAGW